jgi:hypothetical protein
LIHYIFESDLGGPATPAAGDGARDRAVNEEVEKVG